ncbi:hypothetical protein [Bellilinea sp.]|uniref:hypothetical protein n=1 Tax=Bellilinea sp. TaxID=2838785 RepID=UPI0021DEDF73|nr:hypothetical protein [Bellilinea sp.]GIV64882.1 MAG: hypothetical protein KatS3mg046_142 [Bellilinea sp.]
MKKSVIDRLVKKAIALGIECQVIESDGIHAFAIRCEEGTHLALEESGVKILQREIKRRKRQCRHEKAEFMGYTGGYHFYAGEVWDDIREVWCCPQCGHFLTEKQVARLKQRLYEKTTVTEEPPF